MPDMRVLPTQFWTTPRSWVLLYPTDRCKTFILHIYIKGRRKIIFMDFNSFNAEDAEKINPFLQLRGEFSCEATFLNLLIWQSLYDNRYCTKNGILFLRSSFSGRFLYSIPFGDIEQGFEELRRETGQEYPAIWAQDGARFDRFCELYGRYYNITESRDDFDYIYLKQNLAELTGKKFHQKRNHISAFSKQFEWRYEPLCADNVCDIKLCSNRWFNENSGHADQTLDTERRGIDLILDNFEKLGVMGGAIRVRDEIAAFTLASAVNDTVCDIHVEKALPEFSGAYSVINREFARALPQNFRYLNREDDMGLDGLRRAKLSYHPDIMVKKYICSAKESL